MYKEPPDPRQCHLKCCHHTRASIGPVCVVRVPSAHRMLARPVQLFPVTPARSHQRPASIAACFFECRHPRPTRPAETPNSDRRLNFLTRPEKTRAPQRRRPRLPARPREPPPPPHRPRHRRAPPQTPQRLRPPRRHPLRQVRRGRAALHRASPAQPPAQPLLTTAVKSTSTENAKRYRMSFASKPPSFKPNGKRWLRWRLTLP